MNPGGADGSKSMATPRPDGPQPTEQQINEGPYTGRHVGGWKRKRALLAPETLTEPAEGEIELVLGERRAQGAAGDAKGEGGAGAGKGGGKAGEEGGGRR